MDPNMTLRDIWQALAAGDCEEAFYKANELEAWIRKGGFLPDSGGMDRDGWLAALRNLRRALKATQSA